MVTSVLSVSTIQPAAMPQEVESGDNLQLSVCRKFQELLEWNVNFDFYSTALLFSIHLPIGADYSTGAPAAQLGQK